MIAHRFINIDISKVTVQNYKETLSESLSLQVEMFIPPEGSFDDGCLKRYLENVIPSNFSVDVVGNHIEIKEN